MATVQIWSNLMDWQVCCFVAAEEMQAIGMHVIDMCACVCVCLMLLAAARKLTAS